MINDFISAGQQLGISIVSITCELAMFALVFVLLIACIFYFTGFKQHWGKQAIVESLIGMIVVSLLYMWLLNTNGPPDISIFFATGS